MLGSVLAPLWVAGVFKAPIVRNEPSPSECSYVREANRERTASVMVCVVALGFAGEMLPFSTALPIPGAHCCPTALTGGCSGGFAGQGVASPSQQEQGCGHVTVSLSSSVPLRCSTSSGTREDPPEPDQHPQGHAAPRQVSTPGWSHPTASQRRGQSRPHPCTALPAVFMAALGCIRSHRAALGHPCSLAGLSRA